MRITRRYLAAAGTLALAATSLPGHAESADDAAVRKALDNLNKATIAADKAALEAVLSDQLVFGHISGRVETKAELVGMLSLRRRSSNRSRRATPPSAWSATTPLLTTLSLLT